MSLLQHVRPVRPETGATTASLHLQHRCREPVTFVRMLKACYVRRGFGSRVLLALSTLLFEGTSHPCTTLLIFLSSEVTSRRALLMKNQNRSIHHLPSGAFGSWALGLGSGSGCTGFFGTQRPHRVVPESSIVPIGSDIGSNQPGPPVAVHAAVGGTPEAFIGPY